MGVFVISNLPDFAQDCLGENPDALEEDVPPTLTWPNGMTVKAILLPEREDVISPTIIDGYKPAPAVNNQHLRSLECFIDCPSAPQNVKEEGEDASISQNGTELYVSFPVYGANWAMYMSSRGGYTIEETVSSKLLQVRKNASYFWH